MRYGDIDPSRNRGSRRRNKTAVAGVALALTLAGCTTEGSNPDPEPRATPSAAGECIVGAEQAREGLNQEIHKSAEGMAALIIERYHRGGKDTHKEVTESSDSPGSHNINISIYTGQLVGSGDYGEYYLSANVRKNDGEFDPTTVEKIFIGMDTRQTGEFSPKGSLYGLAIFRMSDDCGEDNWRIVRGVTDKAGERPVEYYSTEPEAEMSTAVPAGQAPSVLRLLTYAKFAELEEQAQTILGWSEAGAPVNYAPAS